MGQNLTHYFSYVSVLLASLFLSFYNPVHAAASFFECGVTFYDSGGPDGNYQNNESESWTLCPNNPLDVLTLTFTLVDVESCCDELMIYSGSTADEANLLEGDLEEPASFQSTTPDGCITVTFTSDGSIILTGWEAVTSCVTRPQCETPPLFDLQVTDETTMGATLSWNSIAASQLFNIEIVLIDSMPTGVPTVTDVTSPFVWTEGMSGTGYAFYIQNVCPDGTTTEWSENQFTFRTVPRCGDIFYDTGGPNLSAENRDASWTICPDDPVADRVTLDFTFVQILTCCDSVIIYDGSNADDTMILESDLSAPGTFTSTSVDGCLTVVFDSDGSINSDGWEAMVSCMPRPDCLIPEDLEATNETATGATLSWVSISASQEFNIEIVPTGAEPTGVPTVTNVTVPYTWTGGVSETTYDFYVQNICEDGSGTEWAGPAMFRTIPACGDTFYDTGGPEGPYQNNELESWTFCPDDPADVVILNFTLVDIENGFDLLTIYNGSTADEANLLEGNLEEPAVVTSTAEDGCLTVTFASDGSVTRAGWEAIIGCAPPPPCPNPSDLSANDFVSSGASLSWAENGSSRAWELEILPSGQTPTGTPTNTAELVPFVWTDGAPGTAYDFYVRAICPDDLGNSNWIGPFTFRTSPACGQPFFDSAGPDGDYRNNQDETYLICPDEADSEIVLEFTSLDFNFGDELLVFQGSTQDEILGRVTELPARFVSNAEDGCLTLRFLSNGSGTAAGWEATVDCRLQAPCVDPGNLQVDMVLTNGASISWTDNAGAVFWDVLFVPTGTPPGDTPTEENVFFTDYTWMGGAGNTTYDAYVRAKCPNVDGTSYWIGPVTFTTPPGCGDTFFDTGGADGDYENNENTINVICPDEPGIAVILDFIEVDVESCCDELDVYSGIGRAAPLSLDIEAPATFISTDPSGCITVAFNSDVSVTGSGWAARVLCTSCPDYRAQDVDVEISNVRHDRVDLDWDAFDEAGNFTLEYGPAGFMPGNGDITNGSGTSTRLGGLEPNTDYELYLTYTCVNGDTSIVEGPLAFTTRWPVDVGVVALDAPTAGCNLGNNETITVTLANFGGLPQSLIPINFSVNGEVAGVSQPTDGFYTGVLTTDSTDQFTFDLRYDFMDSDENIIQIWTDFDGDNDRSNDTLTIDFSRFAPPFFEDFEDQEADPGLVVDINADVTNGHGAPSFVLSENLFADGATFELQLPLMVDIMPEDTFSFDYRLIDFGSDLGYELGDDQFLIVTLSTDCGATTDTIFSFTSANQFFVTAAPILVQIPLFPYTGEDILIRIIAARANTGNFWVDIDNIFFSRCNNDLGLDISVTDASASNANDGEIVIRPTIGVPPFSYSWNNGASVDSLGGLEPGDYVVEVSDRFGCTEVVDITVEIVNSTNDLSNQLRDLKLVPNPASNQTLLTVNFVEPIAGHYQLFNAYGQAVQAPQQWTKTESLQTPVDLSQLPAGVYWLQLRAGEAQTAIKLIKVE